MQLDAQEVSGWIVYLRGVRRPIVCNTLIGLIAYHTNDNEFSRYACIMRFIGCYYAVRARMRAQDRNSRPIKSNIRNSGRPCLVN